MKSILLVDPYPFSRGGHYGFWVHLLSETLSGTVHVDLAINSKLSDSRRTLVREALEVRTPLDAVSGFQDWAKRHLDTPKILFLMWAYDFLELLPEIQQIAKRYDVKVFAIAGLSSLLRQSVQKSSSNDERRLLDFTINSHGRWTLLTWDQFLEEKMNCLPHVRAIPDVPNLVCEPFELPEALIAKSRSHRLKIGFLGMLFGYRGLRTILSQYNRSTQDLFICWGPYSDGMVSFFQRRTMRRALAGSISNIFARNELLSEGNLTYLLTQIDYLFIGSSTYPVSSSIAIRAAFLGKKIICDGGDSAIRDFIAHYQTGHVIENLSQLGQIVAADDSMPIDQARLADWYSKENLKRVLDNYLEVTP